MSALASAFTILFMFWTISNLASKLAAKTGNISKGKRLAILGSSLVGSLTYTFSDSFWFSAVEGEVYAMSSFLMALLFWLALKWESEIYTARGNKWLVLISFVVGLSFGVHILSLLVIPAIVMLYFFKTYKNINFKTSTIATIISVFVLLLVFKFIFPFTLKFFSASELFFINTVGLPYNSGSIIAAIILVALFFFGLKYTRKKKKLTANTLILSLLFIMIGFSSWMMLPIRANANTTINENNPSSARELLAYYEREQYGDANVFYDTYYSNTYNREQDAKNPTRDDKPKYEKKDGKYVIVNVYKDVLPNYSDKHKGFIPRMVNPDKETIKRYKMIAGIPQNSQRRPTFGENIKFMSDFQFGYMYGRYLMWNFAGRQNDIQGRYNSLNGNWISGIPFIDAIRLGNQSELSEDSLNNKARNTYFFLPLILGLIGVFFLYGQDKMKFWVLMLFFLFTGLALKIYLNERPFEPRERDYALVGSFYVFAIWIGMGAFALIQNLRNTWSNKLVVPASVLLCFLAVPALMGVQNWDDHDRSGRYTAQSISKSYLTSIQKDVGAIIFTIGDNDTFALWYAQDIEEYRQDVRPINTSLIATDWYIDQMKRKTYTSEAVDIQLEHAQYAYGVRDYTKHESIIDSVRWDIKDFMNWVASDDPRNKYKRIIQKSGGDPDLYPKGTQEMVFYPTNKIRINVNIENVIQSGLVKEKDRDLIVPYIDIDLPKGGLYKNQLIMLDILANNDWKRPLYFTGGSYDDSEYLWMKNYLQLEGLVYKLVPIKTPKNKNNPYLMGRLDADLMYEIVKKWEWGNSDSPEIYHDPETRKNSISYRSNMARLAEVLIDEGKLEKAKEIIDLNLEKMPVDYFGYYSLLTPFIEGYYRIGATEDARKLFEQIAEKYRDQLEYFESLSLNFQYDLGEEILTEIERYRSLIEVIIDNNDEEFMASKIVAFQKHTASFEFLYGSYDYFTSQEDFVAGLYIGGDSIAGRSLIENIAFVYEKRLSQLSSLDHEDQTIYEEIIMDEVNGYRRLMLYVSLHETDAYRDRMEKRVFVAIEPLAMFDSLFSEE